jgi:hypothetical protein
MCSISKLLESLDVLSLAVGQFGQWKIEEKVIAGCRGSEHVKKRKTLVAQKHTLVSLYIGHVHTWAVVCQGAYTCRLHY